MVVTRDCQCVPAYYQQKQKLAQSEGMLILSRKSNLKSMLLNHCLQVMIKEKIERREGARDGEGETR